MSKLSSKITAFIILVYIGVFFVSFIFLPKEKRSSEENRELSVIADVTAEEIYDGRLFSEISDYMTDRFPLRSNWISLSAEIKSDLTESIINGIYVGDGMLLETGLDKQTEGFASTAASINSYASRFKGTVYLAVIPTSSGIYNEQLPEYMLTVRENTRISRFYEQLSSSIRRIDAYNILKSQKENYIYYRNDNRWTSYGAYTVYRSVIQKLGFNPTAYDKYTIEHITDDYRGNLYNKCLYSSMKADIIDFYKYPDGAQIVSCIGTDTEGRRFEKAIYDKMYLDSDDKYNVFYGKPAMLTEIRTTVNNNKKLLVIKDSFCDSFIPFLIQHYSEIAIVDPAMIDGSIKEVVSPDEYDQTLIIIGINTLGTRNLSALNK